MQISGRSPTTAALVGVVLLTPTVAFSIDFNECGSFECDGNGCLVFRADDGTRYALIVPGGSYQPKYTPGNRACITGDLGCTSTCAGVPLCVTEASRSPWHAISGVYSISAEFAQGQFLNVSTVSDELHINEWTDTKNSDPPVAPYLWVACGKRGTVVRIATEDHYSPVDQRCVAAGDILGQYFTSPTDPSSVSQVCGSRDSGLPLNRMGGDPSRATVDYHGNVWVPNRSDIKYDDPYDDRDQGELIFGHVVKIGTGLAYQWVDRNGNGVLDTSRCDGTICDPLDWPNQIPTGECSDADIAGAKDELILRYRVAHA